MSGAARLAWLGCAPALLAMACGAPPPDPRGDASSAAVDASWELASADAAEPARGDYIPYLAGEYHRVFAPPGTRYLNDHTLFVDAAGTWHVIGITHESAGDPHAERAFLHATAPSLTGPWTSRADALEADPALNESAIWAPHVVETRPGRWSMFYCFIQIVPEGESTCMRRADSVDLVAWRRLERTSTREDRPPGGRDAFLLRDGARWLLYSVGVSASRHGQILVTETGDLDDPRGWSPLSVALEDPRPDLPWGSVESPFVVPYAGSFYLFVTRTADGSSTDYARTLVFRSADPLRFAWRPIAELRAHAAEVVTHEGRHYLTSGGWTSLIGEANRGLSVAPLRWAAAP